MLSRSGKSLVAMALIFSIGGHWAFLQGVAWVTMVVDYSKEAPISIAVSKTLDGKHPCNLCKFVNKGKAAESKREATKVKTKLDLWLPIQAITLSSADLVAVEFTPLDPSLTSFSISPPVPPPRLS